MQYTYGGNQQVIQTAPPVSVRRAASFPFPVFRAASLPRILPPSVPGNPSASGNLYIEPHHRQQVLRPSTEPVIPNSVLMKWGAPTWTLFHVLAEKVKPGQFPSIRNELIDNIVLIATNLPCPNCSGHASQFIKQVNLNAIQTQDHLRYFLFHFHNTVNQRKNVPVFDFDDVAEKYSTMNTGEIIHRFMYFFEGKYARTNHLVPQGFARANIARKLKEWFDTHIGMFD